MATVVVNDSEESKANLRKNSAYKSALAKWRSISSTDGLTKHSNDALLQMLDGYHDAPYTAVGLPTGVNDRIIVHDIQRTLTITKPTDLPAGQSWDCHICTGNVAGGTDGFVGFTDALSVSLNAGQRYGNIGNSIEQNSSAATAYWDAPVMVSRVLSGNDTFGLAYTPTGTNFGMVDIPSQFLDGRSRVIGLCYEVVNATAPLYVSGQAGCYAFPSNTRRFAATVGETYGPGTQVWSPSNNVSLGTTTAAISVTAPAEVAISTAPPSNVALASRAHNWTTWHAKEGCYVNAVFESIPEMTHPRPVKRFIQDSGQSALGQSYQTLMGLDSGYYMSSSGAISTRRVVGRSDTMTATLLGPAVTSFDYDHWINRTVDVPVRRSGAYFTGLNENSVLQLKVRFIIERVPDVFDERLYSLSQLPPPADPRFWEMYSRVCNHVPAGCMQTENPLGEWFNQLTDTVKRWAPVVGNTIGNFVPGASAMGALVSKAASLAHQMNQESPKLEHKDEKAKKKQASKAEKAKQKRAPAPAGGRGV